jgi:hypothetical protein
MKRTIAVAALASFALVPAAAEAHGGKSKVLRGSFTLVGGDGDYVRGKFGQAQLVDGKRSDKLSVHVRRLAKRTTYTFKLQTGSCGGAEVTGWRYRTLKTSRKGVGNAWARSRTFKVAKGVKYYVAVYGPDGQMVVCARLSSKGKAHPHKSRGRDHDKGRGRSDDKPRGKSDGAPGRAEDKPRGRSEDAPGHAEDKSRGRSEDAPGQAEDKTRGKRDDAPRGHGRDKDKKPGRG